MNKNDLIDCDLVMKGGVTSGVVYPFVVSELTKTHRLRAVGGTSAGAIAATIAAAAEFSRQSSETQSGHDGFAKITILGKELATTLLDRFQPEPQFKRLFGILVAASDTSKGRSIKTRVLKAVLWQTLFFWMVPLLIGLVTALWLGLKLASLGLAVSIVIVALIIGATLAGHRIYQDIVRELPASLFGMCSGMGNRNGDEHIPGLTEWMHSNIQDVAGRGLDDDPLTVADLDAHDIQIASMTTDLSSGRPYQLPLKTRIFAFSKSEFETLFPAAIVNHLVAKGWKIDAPAHLGGDVPEDLYALPANGDFPLLLVARMSLSFPFLIQAIPLYRRDFELSDGPWVKCLFSDGGISSNFPIHMFDSLAPTRPTFGISLGKYDPNRHGTGEDARLRLGPCRTDAHRLEHKTLNSTSGFAGTILNTAKDWQDTLQASLPGYMDRNVEILLTPQEGGLNLTMPSNVIEKLGEIGTHACHRLIETFEFEEHRYVRALATYPQLQVSLDQLAKVIETDPGYLHTLQEHKPKRFKNVTKAWRKSKLAPFVKQLAALGTSNLFNEHTPATDGKVRLVADADRDPR